ncbi:phage major capsid protein [Candidatus Mesenet endosymbiont of Agriotes lineatus]|uniref:phage major capsid protein n=1 Tax=Candidatus Mesenet endosymbiont of Agriotes lineatus TaxID=3077948 RepID=UPI0030CE4ACE
MSLTDIACRINDLASSWEQFKLVNERRLKEIEGKGYAESATTEQLNKISNAIDDCKERVETLETAMQRPEVNGRFEDNYPQSKAFSEYLRKGTVDNLMKYEQKALTSTGPEGGYLITKEISKRIHQNITDISPMRQLCSSEEISTESIEYIIEGDDKTFVGWHEEGDNILDNQSTQKFKNIKITTYELYAQPQITQKLLDDAFVNIEAWLVGKLVEAFSAKENEAFIKGDGKTQPQGILSYKNSKKQGEVEQIESEKLNSDAVVKLYYSLNESYAKNASFLMNRSVLQEVRLLKLEQSSQYLWQPGLSLGAKDTIMGIPVYQVADMPAGLSSSTRDAKPKLPSGIEESHKVIAIANFKQAYKIVDHRGMKILRDPFTSKGFIKLYTTKRVGGGLINTNAIKLLKIEKTL